jgi:hypothetical protein
VVVHPASFHRRMLFTSPAFRQSSYTCRAISIERSDLMVTTQRDQVIQRCSISETRSSAIDMCRKSQMRRLRTDIEPSVTDSAVVSVVSGNKTTSTGYVNAVPMPHHTARAKSYGERPGTPYKATNENLVWWMETNRGTSGIAQQRTVTGILSSSADSNERQKQEKRKPIS